jgi:hypothetical protein
MKTALLFATLLLATSVLAQTDQTWTLAQSTFTYHMSHPLHEVDGTSHAARGKGVCRASQCDFLLAVPVKTFDSGDTNRDLHMLQVTRGAQFPIVTVKFHLPEAELTLPMLDCDLEVEFAGNIAHYHHVPFQQVVDGSSRHITGTIPTTLSDFKIDPPTFFTVPIKNAIPVHVDVVWHPS